MRCWWFIAAAASAVSGCVQQLPSPEWEGRGWREITTDHFVVNTNLDGRHALRVVQSLEESRAAMLTCAWKGAADPPGRTEVVAFWSGTKDYSLGYRLGRVCAQQPFGRLMAFLASDVGTVPEVMPHEIAHDLSRWFMPVQPVWFSEGLAVYLQSVRFDAERQVAIMGQPAQWLLDFVNRQPMLPLEQLFAIEDMPTSPYEVRRVYASSWAVVDHLLNKHGPQFGEFQTSIARLEGWRSAWSSAFVDPEFANLDDEIGARLRRHQSLILKMPMSAPKYSTNVRKLSAGAVQGLYARLSICDRDRDASERAVQAALAAEPTDINALAVQFYYFTPNTEDDEIIAAKATAAHPRNGIAWLMAADAAPNPEATLAALTRAKEQLPYHPVIRLKIGQQKILRGQAFQALPDTRIALRGLGPTPEVVRAHLIALAANRRCRDAHRLANNTIPGWSPEALKELRRPVTPEQMYCAAHADYNAPNSQMAKED